MAVGATIVWFRNDLRIQDNRALVAASRRGGRVIPVFIWAPEEDGAWPPGCASRWWLRQSSIALDKDLHRRGSKLIIRSGQSSAVLRSLVRETDADAVYFSRRYEACAVERAAELRRGGIDVETFNASLLIEPWEVASTSGKPFRVFTHYWNRCLQQLETANIAPLDEPANINSLPRSLASLEPDSLELGLDKTRISGLEARWKPGAAEAHSRLGSFLRDKIQAYGQDRDCLYLEATSCLSPHLRFGEIGPRQLWSAVKHRDRTSSSGADAAPFFRIFNPVSQGGKFDPEGEYVRRWVPELRHLPKKLIHQPWIAPRSELNAAGVTMGVTYPQRIVDHDMARRRALDRFHAL